MVHIAEVFVSRRSLRKLAMIGLLGVPALLVACSSGVSPADLDAVKQGAASEQQKAAALQQQLSTKVQEVQAAQQQLAAKAQDASAVQKAVSEEIAKNFATYDANRPLWRIQPGTAPRMRELTESFNLMWFAAKEGNWEFAGFERYRADEEVKAILVTRPGRATSMNDWATPHLKALDDAIKAKDRLAFERAYDNAIAGCNACHAASTGGGFQIKSIKIARPTAPLYPNVEFKGN